MGVPIHPALRVDWFSVAGSLAKGRPTGVERAHATASRRGVGFFVAASGPGEREWTRIASTSGTASCSPTWAGRTRMRGGSRPSPRCWTLTCPPSSTTSTPRSSVTPRPARSSRAVSPRSTASRAPCCGGSASCSPAGTTNRTSLAAGGSAGGTSRSASIRSTPTSPCRGCGRAWSGPLQENWRGDLGRPAGHGPVAQHAAGPRPGHHRGGLPGRICQPVAAGRGGATRPGQGAERGRVPPPGRGRPVHDRHPPARPLASPTSAPSPSA